MCNFVMLCGLPGSGKTTYAKELSDKGYVIHSSDDIRYELFGDVNIQSDNGKVFDVLHKRVIEDLSKGNSVVYDATNINSNRRKKFLNKIKHLNCDKTAIIFGVPIEECIMRDSIRDKQVGEYVINKMYMVWQTPSYHEGWNSIKIVGNTARFNLNDTITAMNIDQENSNHSLSLLEHCIKAFDFIHDNHYEHENYKELLFATLLHDNGKVKTKVRLNRKGEYDGNYHYYNHESVGSYDLLTYYSFFNLTEQERITISSLVSYHMRLYHSPKETVIEKFGSEFAELLSIIHDADLFAH